MQEQQLQWISARRPVAVYAADAGQSRGRLVSEPHCPMRSPFQRDRDRIVHATAFRRLNYKTQVFLFHEGDHYRSRLTHSLEVAQIARSIARLLYLDEDLAEALALAHDLGHPPFGHAGERALDRAMVEFGGFDHNAQSLRVVTLLERKYAAFDGLNLSFETLEGLVKHNGPLIGDHARGGEPDQILLRTVQAVGLAKHLALDQFASAEAQVAAIADDIAWHNHDIDDGLRAGLLSIDDLVDVPLVGRFVSDVLTGSATTEHRRQIYEVNRRMITAMIADCVAETRSRLAGIDARHPNDLRRAERATVTFSDAMTEGLTGLKSFLFKNVYRHPRIDRIMSNAEAVLTGLFQRYLSDASSLPDSRGTGLSGCNEAERARSIADFIAGMTDRFAIAEHRRLFDATPDLG